MGGLHAKGRRAGEGPRHRRHLKEPDVWIDATYVKARQDGRVVSVAVVIAVGVKGETGEREVF